MSNKRSIVWLILSALPFILTLLGTTPAANAKTLFISGATKGYLAPCGCTKPMSGGIRRRATLINQLKEPGDFVLELGPFAGPLGRQSEIKAETQAQALQQMGTDAFTLTKLDLQLGTGVIETYTRISEAALIDDTTFLTTPDWIIATDTNAEDQADTISIARSLIRRSNGKPTILVTQANEESAEQIARTLPELSLIIYASSSNPTGVAKRVGKTWVGTAGEQGKYVLTFTFTNSGFESPTVFDLGPNITDSPTVSRQYSQYLDRLRAEKLVERMPKPRDDHYAGADACMSCHNIEHQIWTDSKHSQAWATLEADGHDADPDCVSCHTVGIDSTKGFLVKERTPHLTDVGCESCHGAGYNHIQAPEKVKMPTVGKNSCTPCHNLAHSPNFDFEKYWEKIKH